MATITSVKPATNLQKAAVRQINAWNDVAQIIHLADDGTKIATVIFTAYSHGGPITYYEAFEMANVTDNDHDMRIFRKVTKPNEMGERYDNPALWGEFYARMYPTN